jgi:TldD protein
MTGRYHAPFAEHGSHTVDAEIADRLLRIALEKGGDYADLFFEYSVSGSYAYDEQILKSARRAVSMGLGVRVMKGDATGYAYCEDFSFDAMKRASETAAQIAAGGQLVAPLAVSMRDTPSRYPVSVESLALDGEAKKAILERADRAARASDPRVVRVDASFAESVREVLIANSLGHMVRDRQPLIRFGVSVIAEDGGNRQSGSSGGGGRMGLEYFEGQAP